MEVYTTVSKDRNQRKGQSVLLPYQTKHVCMGKWVVDDLQDRPPIRVHASSIYVHAYFGFAQLRR